MSMTPIPYEAVLCRAIDQLRSPWGLEIPAFLRQYPEYAEELTRDLPALVSAGPAAINRALDDQCVAVLCELFAWR